MWLNVLRNSCTVPYLFLLQIAEHDKKLFCHPCHQKLFCPQDSAPVKSVMQVLPIQGMFIVVST